MKKFLTTLLFLVASSFATPKFVQGPTQGNSNEFVNTLSFTMPGNVTKHNTLIVFVAMHDDALAVSPTINTPTDTLGDTFTAVAAQTSAGKSSFKAFVVKDIASTGADTITVTTSNTNTDIQLYAAEYSGVDNVNTIEGTPATATATSGTSISTGSTTTTTANDTIISWAYDQSSSHLSWSNANGSIREITSEGSGAVSTYAEMINKAAGTYSNTFSFDGTSSAALHAGIFALKSTGGSAPSTITAIPDSITTDLSWTPPMFQASPGTWQGGLQLGYVLYFPTPIELTGTTACTSGAPCQWTLKDNNGNTLYTQTTSGTTLGKVTLLDGGYGYSSTPTVTVTGGGGSGAVITANLTGQVVTSLTISNAGSGYTTTPIITISGGGGSNAYAVAGNYSAFGILSCWGSADNTNCTFTAPTDYPSGYTGTLSATDGTNTVNIPLTISNRYNLNEWLAQRGRVQMYNSQAQSLVGTNTGGIFQTTQPRKIIFRQPPANSVDGVGEMAIIDQPNDYSGSGFPVTAGSSINRPAWSYDGKYFLTSDYSCVPTGFCSFGTSSYHVLRTDGSSKTVLPATYAPFMWSYLAPKYLVGSDATTIRMIDTSSVAETTTTIVTGNPSTSGATLGQFSQPNGSLYPFINGPHGVPSNLALNVDNVSLAGNVVDVHVSNGNYFVKGQTVTLSGLTNATFLNGQSFTLTTSANNFSGDLIGNFTHANYSSTAEPTGKALLVCVPGNACTPEIWVYDLSACEPTPTLNCGSAIDHWSININPGTFDDLGNAHCAVATDSGNVALGLPDENTNTTNCQYHLHDHYFRRGFGEEWWGNHGFYSTTGEYNFFRRQANSTIGAGYPNPAVGAPYMSHPAFDWTGNLMSYGGFDKCVPSGNGCNQSRPSGAGIWDWRTNTQAVVFYANQSVGHTAWDGFDSNKLYFDGNCQVGQLNFAATSLFYHRCLMFTWTNPGTTYTKTLIDLGSRPSATNSGSAVSFFFGPIQSPDATKAGEASPMTLSVNPVPSRLSPLQFQNAPTLGWVYYVARPASPINVKLNSTSSAQIAWNAHALNHETQKYQLWKQASCTGSWSRLSTTNAVYLQASVYTATDGSLSAGQTACYALTSIEWEGAESDTLSNIVGVTNTAGVFSNSSNRVGEVNFDTTAPAVVTSVSSTAIALPTATAPSISATSGGSISVSGQYWFKVAYCIFSDYPANNTPQCSAPSSAVSVSVNGTSNTAVQLSTNAEMDGQHAIQFYASNVTGGSAPASGTFHLQNCREHSGQTVAHSFFYFPSPTFGGGFGASEVCTIDTIQTANSIVTTSPTLGYTLSWTAPADVDVRYYAIYYRDSSAPPVSSIGSNDSKRLTAQNYLIATVPVGVTTYKHTTPNWATANPHYGIVAVDTQGNFSNGVCRQGNNTSESCN